MDKKIILGAVLGVLLLGGGAWYYVSQNQASSEPGAETVATVNGEAITRDELDNTESQIATSQQLDLATLDETTRAQVQTQALDTLVGNRLIIQAAEQADVTASDEEVETQMSSIKGRFETDEAYQQALSDENLTESELREQVATDIAAQAYLAQAVDLESVEVTDEEVQTVYDQQNDGTEGFPALEDVREQIVAYLQQQKQQELLAAHVDQLRAEADVEILI